MMYPTNATRYMLYMRQFRAALTPGGRFLLMDHAPDDPTIKSRAGAFHHGMRVVPIDAEVQEAKLAGFTLVQPQFDSWPFFGNGFALLLAP